MSEVEIVGWRVRVRFANGTMPPKWVHEPENMLATGRSSSFRFATIEAALAEANYWIDADSYAYPVPIRRRRRLEAVVKHLSGYGRAILLVGDDLVEGDRVTIRKIPARPNDSSYAFARRIEPVIFKVGILLIDAMVAAGLAASASQARQLIEQEAVMVDSVVMRNPNFVPPIGFVGVTVGTLRRRDVQMKFEA